MPICTFSVLHYVRWISQTVTFIFYKNDCVLLCESHFFGHWAQARFPPFLVNICLLYNFFSRSFPYIHARKLLDSFKLFVLFCLFMVWSRVQGSFWVLTKHWFLQCGVCDWFWAKMVFSKMGLGWGWGAFWQECFSLCSPTDPVRPFSTRCVATQRVTVQTGTLMPYGILT